MPHASVWSTQKAAGAVPRDMVLEPGRVGALRNSEKPAAPGVGAEALLVRGDAGRRPGGAGPRRSPAAAAPRGWRLTSTARDRRSALERLQQRGTAKAGGRFRRRASSRWPRGGPRRPGPGKPVRLRARPSPPRVSGHGCRAGTDVKRSPASPSKRRELVAQNRRQPERHGGAVDDLEQRQRGLTGDGLPQPFFAERPRVEALDVRHVRVQDQRDGATVLRPRALTLAASPGSRARGRAGRPGGRSRARRSTDEPVVERMGDPERRVDVVPARPSAHVRPSRARGRGRAVTSPGLAQRPKLVGRYSLTCQGLSDFRGRAPRA